MTSKLVIGGFIIVAMFDSALNLAGIRPADYISHTVGWEATR